MSQSSRGKSSERIANTSYSSSSGIHNNNNNISNNLAVNNTLNHNNSYSIRDARDNQQKDLITEMKRLKKNFQELKSPIIQKKYFGMNGGQGQQQQQQQQHQGNSQMYSVFQQGEQGNTYNSQNNNSFNSNEQFNSNPLQTFQHHQNYQNDSQRQSSQNRGKANSQQLHYQHSVSYNHVPKGQQSDSNRNHYASQDEDRSEEIENNITQLGLVNQSINQSFNYNNSLYTKTMPPSYQPGSESNRSQGRIGNISNNTLNHNQERQQQQNEGRQLQKEHTNTIYQQQQQLQSRQNNSLKRISDKISNIKDRAEKIEWIKNIEKKNFQFSNEVLQEGTSQIYLNVKQDAKECQTEDISNIYVEKQINDESLKEIDRLREQLKKLELDLDLKEQALREQEKSIKFQIEEKQVRIKEQDQQLEKVLDDLNRLQKENIKVNNALKQAQENLALNGKNQNNTSSQHLLPSEFKTKWESLVTDGVANTFINFFENPLILTNLLQDLFIIIHEISKNHIKETNTKVMDLLQLDKKHAKVYEQNLSKLYQDFNNDIFKIIPETSNPKIATILQKFKLQANKIITHEYYSEFQNMKSDYIDEDEVDDDDNLEGGDSNEQQGVKKIAIFRDTLFFEQNQEDFKQYLEELYESNEILEFIEQFYRLSIHMHLHDPSLSLPVQNFKNRIFEYIPYKKNNFYLIDGFVQQNVPALTVIPPVMRNNQIYTGIKPSVILLTEDIINERIQSKIDAALQKEQALLNSNTNNLKSNNSANKSEESNPSSSNNLKEEPNNLQKQQSPQAQQNIEKSIQKIQEKQNSLQSAKYKTEIQNEITKSITEFDTTQNQENIASNSNKQSYSLKQEQNINEHVSLKIKSNKKQSPEKKQTESLQNSRYVSKDNKENSDQFINQSQPITSPNNKSIANLKNISQVSQKLDSSSKKQGYLNFGSIQTSPKQDLLNLISPRMDSSHKKAKNDNKEPLLSQSKFCSKIYENASASSKKKLNFESSHSEKKNLALNLNKSGIINPNLENGKEEIVKNLFLTSRSHHSKSTKQKDDNQNNTHNFSNKNIWKGQLSSLNRSEIDKRAIFDDLTNQTMFQNNIPQSSSQHSKMINKLENNKNMSFLKKGSFTGKNKNSLSSHQNTSYLNSVINKQTQDSVQLLQTLQIDNKNQKNKIFYKDDQDYDEQDIQEERFSLNYKSKNISIERQQIKDEPSPISSRNNKNLNESKLNFSNAVNNNDQERSGIHSNNQSSQKLRRSNRSEDENRIINQNTIFNKHFKNNSIQNDVQKNSNISISQQNSTVASKAYSFNTFLENHRRNIQKNEKDQSQIYRQDSSSSSRDNKQSKTSNANQKEQLNKSSANTSRLFKKDSFDQKSVITHNQSSIINNQSSFTKSPIDIKSIESKQKKADDFYANLRKQINFSQQYGGSQSNVSQGSSQVLIGNNIIKEPKNLPLKSSRDISPSSLQLNCSKTDRLLKYSEHATSNIGNYFPPEGMVNSNSLKPSNPRTASMKRALQNIIDSFSSDDDVEEQSQNQKKQRDSDIIQDDSLIEELNQQRDSNLGRQINNYTKNSSKNECNENRPFSFQSGLSLQTHHKKNKTFEKLYNDLKQKKSFTQNPIKANKEFLSKI